MVVYNASRNLDSVDHGAKNVDDRSSHRALAASRFANQTQRFALFQPETHAVHGFYFGDLTREHTSHNGEAHTQILNVENLLETGQRINPATFRLDGTRAVAAQRWELSPRPVTAEQKIAEGHRGKIYVVTKAHKR